MKAIIISGFALGFLLGVCSTMAKADKVAEGKAPFMVEKETGKKFYMRPAVHHFRTHHLASNSKAHYKTNK
jgi:hypothetical protein